MTTTTQPKLNPRPWSPHLLRAFIMGDATLADLEGVGVKTLYDIAEIGFFYLEQGRIDVAKTIFTGLNLLDPLDSYFCTALGAIAQRTGQLTDAETHYCEALLANPVNVTALANRGDVRLQLQRFDEGIADLERAAALDPRRQDPTHARTRLLLEALGRFRG
jgi:tetratricopeptide (TPR) repeat protein